jgi:hypothetical protein
VAARFGLEDDAPAERVGRRDGAHDDAIAGGGEERALEARLPEVAPERVRAVHVAQVMEARRRVDASPTARGLEAIEHPDIGTPRVGHTEDEIGVR